MPTAGRSRDRIALTRAAIVSLASVIAGAGCTTSGDAGPAGGFDSGSPGGDAARESSAARISCSMAGNTCLCLVDDPQPSQIDACGPSTVARGDAERGICCTTESLCSCVPYVCRSDPAAEICQCATVVALAMVTFGTPVAECPAPTAAQKCCSSPDNGSCICSRLACADEEIQVSGCSAAAAGPCAIGEAIPACR